MSVTAPPPPRRCLYRRKHFTTGSRVRWTSMDSAKPLHHLAHLFAGFFSAALHLILCVRKVYPKETFSRKRKLGCITWWSDSQVLCDYIATLAKSIQDGLQSKLIAAVAILILSNDNSIRTNGEEGDRQTQQPIVVEKFIMEFRNHRNFWAAPGFYTSPYSMHGNLSGQSVGAIRAPTPSTATYRGPLASAAAETYLQDAFRDLLLKLHFCDVQHPMKHASRNEHARGLSGLSFHVQVQTTIPLEVDPTSAAVGGNSSTAALASAAGIVLTSPQHLEAVARMKCSWLPSVNISAAQPIGDDDYSSRLIASSERTAISDNTQLPDAIVDPEGHPPQKKRRFAQNAAGDSEIRDDDCESEDDDADDDDSNYVILKTIRVLIMPVGKVLEIFRFRLQQPDAGSSSTVNLDQQVAEVVKVKVDTSSQFGGAASQHLLPQPVGAGADMLKVEIDEEYMQLLDSLME